MDREGPRSFRASPRHRRVFEETAVQHHTLEARPELGRRKTRQGASALQPAFADPSPRSHQAGRRGTPTVINTIDTGPPTSSVSPLPTATTSNTFTVNMTGCRRPPHGSGIASFALYVSENGGPVPGACSSRESRPSLDRDRAGYGARSTFTGVTGHTYAFYSVATDNVGHIQSMPTAAEATTQVIAIPPPVTVTSVHFATIKVKVGKGKKAKTKAEKVLEIHFSGSLSGAGNLAAYQVLSGTTKKRVTTFKKRVPLQSAVYNPSTLTVTLAPKSQFDLTGPEQLRITAADLLDSNSRSLDGNDDGQPGGNFVATLSKSGIRVAQAESNRDPSCRHIPPWHASCSVQNAGCRST